MLALFQRRPPRDATATSAAPPARRRLYRLSNRRYRSRNCANLRRFGELSSSSSSDGASGGMVSTCDRRLAREVRDMQRRVAELERRRALLHSVALSAPANAAAHGLTLVRQFYERFAHGYDPARAPQHARVTETFLRAAMHQDVRCTEFQGVDVFLKQYELSTQHHVSFKLALHRVDVLSHEPDGDGVLLIKAEAVCTLRIKRATLERFFPSIIRDEALTQQLIGKEYAMRYDKVFHLLGGRVFQHESRVDFCAGILELVQDPFVAMKLLEASVMTRHGHLKVDEHIEEGRHELENAVL